MLKPTFTESGACLPCSGTRPPAASCFCHLAERTLKRKDAESAPTCRSRVFVRRATAKAGDRYKKGLVPPQNSAVRRLLLRFWPCRVEEGAFPRRVSFTASAAGCVGHRSPSVSHLRYSRLDASLRSRPLAGQRPPCCVRAARRPVCSGFSRMARERPASVSEPALVPRRCGRLCRSRQADRFCRSCACPQHRARTLASRQARTCGVLYGLRRTKKNRRRLRTAVSSRTARRRPAQEGRKEARYGGLRSCASSAGVVGGLFPTRAKPAGFPKGKWCASGGASDEISGRYAFSRL